jgi:DNA-binding Lrp family transcriptional regulator
MAVFRIEKTQNYTIMSNHHLRNKALTLKAKGLLSQMLSLPEEWDYTLGGLAEINRESTDAIRTAVKELEREGYIVRSRIRNEKGQMAGADYVIYEIPQNRPEPSEPDEQELTQEREDEGPDAPDPAPASDEPESRVPVSVKPIWENPIWVNPTQLNKDISSKEKLTKELGLKGKESNFLREIPIQQKLKKLRATEPCRA